MRFYTAVNCMDGRVQLPVIAYLKKRFRVEFIDMITEPGPGGVLATGTNKPLIKSIFYRINISLERHNSSGIAIVAHHDCAGNPVTDNEQLAHLHKAAKALKSEYPHVPIVKLWVNEQWQVREIAE